MSGNWIYPLISIIFLAVLFIDRLSWMSRVFSQSKGQETESENTLTKKICTVVIGVATLVIAIAVYVEHG